MCACCTARPESVHLQRRSISSVRWWITLIASIQWPSSCWPRPKSFSWLASSAGSTRSKADSLRWGCHQSLFCYSLILNHVLSRKLKTCLYIVWSDVTKSMVMIRSPFCGYNTTLCVELKGEDLSCYSNKIESVSLRKCWVKRRRFIVLFK